MSRSVKLLLLLAVGLALAVGGTWAYARHLPNTHEYTQTITIAHNPPDTWNLLRHIQEYPRWRQGLRTVIPTDSSEDGLTKWTEVWDRQKLYVHIISAKIPDSLYLELEAERHTYRKEWTWATEIVPPDSIRISLKERQWVQPPFLRLYQHFFPNQNDEVAAALRDVAQGFSRP